MDHGRVAGDHGAHDLRRRDLLAVGQLVDQPVDRIHRPPAQLLQPAGPSRVVAPADHIQAAGYLSVVVRPRGEDPSRAQVDELDRHRRGTEVDDDPRDARGAVPGFDADQLQATGLANQRHGRHPVRSP